MSVHSTLLKNKLFIPPLRRRAVERQRLLSRLTEGVGGPLTLVSAPAGFGKTTLLAAWTAQQVLPVAWVSLDEADNDPVRFLSYVIAALHTVIAGVGNEAQAIMSQPQPAALQAAITALINELDTVIQPFVLLLDDYHTITEPAVHDALAYLIEHLPPSMHVLLATRADPPLPLARLRARGQLVEVRAADLRFTPDEAAELFNPIMGLQLTPQDIDALERRTEGWVAGLQMAAIALQGRDDAAAFSQAFSGSHRYVLDYLVEEVLSRQPEPVQAFLLRTAILERMCEPLCEAVLREGEGVRGSKGEERGSMGDDSPSPILPFSSSPSHPLTPSPLLPLSLEQLERSNLFVIALDDEGRWYRYHHLFADLLRARLRQMDPQGIPGLHRRAAEWFERNGMVGEAISHALAGGDDERAARLIEENSYAVLSRGELATLLHWIKQLSVDRVRERPALSVMLAWIYNFAGQWDRVEALLQQAEQVIDPTAPGVQTLQGTIAVMRAHQADMRGDMVRAVELAQLADALLPAEALIQRSMVAFTLERAYRAQTDLARACAAAAEIVRIGRALDNVWTVAVGLSELAGLRRLQGQLREAERLYEEAAEFATERHSRHFGTVSMIDVGLADVLRERNDLDAASAYVQAGIDHLKGWNNPTNLVWGYATLGRIRLAQGNLQAARLALVQADRVRRQQGVFPQIGIQVEVDWVRLWLAEGNLDEAMRWVSANQLQPGDILPFARELQYLTLARVLIASGRYAEAQHLLGRLAQATAQGGRNGRLIEVLALLALACRAQGDQAQALATLGKCLALAQPESYTRVFVDEGEPMRFLILDWGLGIDGQAGSLRSYVKRLMDAFPAEEQSAHPATAAIENPQSTRSVQNLVEPLSERELEVLRLLAAGLSNTQIAQKLFVTTGTIKTHVHNIYGKLTAQNRAQAVTRATELGLL